MSLLSPLPLIAAHQAFDGPGLRFLVRVGVQLWRRAAAGGGTDAAETGQAQVRRILVVRHVRQRLRGEHQLPETPRDVRWRSS